jgi:hypothetical protein
MMELLLLLPAEQLQLLLQWPAAGPAGTPKQRNETV